MRSSKSSPPPHNERKPLFRNKDPEQPKINELLFSKVMLGSFSVATHMDHPWNSHCSRVSNRGIQKGLCIITDCTRVGEKNVLDHKGGASSGVG